MDYDTDEDVIADDDSDDVSLEDPDVDIPMEWLIADDNASLAAMVDAADAETLAAGLRRDTVMVRDGAPQQFHQYFPLWSARNEDGGLAGRYNMPGYYRPAILPEDAQNQPSKYARRWGVNPNADEPGRSMLTPYEDPTGKSPTHPLKSDMRMTAVS